MDMRLSLCSAICLLSLLSGCAQFTSMDKSFRQGTKSVSPSKGEFDDETEETWVREAGVEARGDRPIEKDNDPFRNILMSPTAKSIERNLGIQ